MGTPRKERGERPRCKCGCGTLVPWNAKNCRWYVYVPEHFPHRKKTDEEKKEAQRLRNAKAMRKRDPEEWAAYMREYRLRNKDELSEMRKIRYHRDPERHRLYMREWRKKNLEHARAREKALYHRDPARRGHPSKMARLKVDFPYDAYLKMHEAQGGVCAICRQSQHEKSRKQMLEIDHDHETGKVRGLLCSMCNRGMGLFRDDPELMEVAASYLRDRSG